MSDLLKVLFVDDDPKVLSGLRRSMHAYSRRCECIFVTNGKEGLEVFKTTPIDVVVSDMRMPIMDGAEFLNHVREHHPETVRIILSGYAAQDSVMRTVGPAHLYLAKPCSPETLLNAVTRPLALRKYLSSPNLRKTLSGLTTLPSLPEIYTDLERQFNSAKGSVQTVAELISQDVAMTAELLKLTNSAYFSTTGRVSTPLQAVRILGFETVQALVLRIGIFRQFNASGESLGLMRSLDVYSVHLGMVAKAIAKSEGADETACGIAYCVGLLSSIGCLVLLDSYPDRMLSVLRHVEDKNIPLHVAEREEFGASHGVVGAYLLGLWGFSDTIVEAVAYASTPSVSPVRDNLHLTVLHAATILGPNYPPAKGDIVPFDWDMNYIHEVGKESSLPHWKTEIAKMKAEWANA